MRVLVIDDEAPVSMSWSICLKSQKNIEIAGTFTSPLETRKASVI